MATAATSSSSMQYIRFGKTGLRVSRICLGCMSYGSPAWNSWSLNSDESLKMIKKAYDAGINFFDTANMYSNGVSEEILGKAIRQFGFPRDRIVVATKVFFPVMPEVGMGFPAMPECLKRGDLVNTFGLSRKHIFDAVDASLKRLQLDYIDLYQIHRFDKNTPIEETMEALHDLVKMGKVRYIGASSMHAWEFQKANNIAEKNGWTKFVSMQNLYNLLYREEEREMIPYCVDQGIAQIPWSPLSMGKLTGKKRDTVRSEKSSAFHKRMFGDRYEEMEDAIIENVIALGEKKKVPPAQIALAWILSKSHVTAPIVGIRKEEHLNDAIEALNVQLTEEEIQQLEAPYVPRPLIPM
ncbi:hypothetical protein LRAMOSA02552 [Lichtheimia ramosa]|uniref:NADP-dependent oxidoreductase domain-containing protein n=1 Tax=Lichtheimia ramosa TaxID=688394 RepID=A0A077WR98_9FUNG|nr:hypothetical protein LRAMOSA02552 [Lichtheimia ramosa]